jgi:hypothetical protein
LRQDRVFELLRVTGEGVKSTAMCLGNDLQLLALIVKRNKLLASQG